MIETAAKMTMLALLAAAAPVETVEASLWAQWGLAGVVVAYVLWRDGQREKRMGAALDRQQSWIRETLVETLQRNAAAMERMATWLEDDGAARFQQPTARRAHPEHAHDHHG